MPGAMEAPEVVDGSNESYSCQAASYTLPSPMVFPGGVFQPRVDYAIPSMTVGATTWKIAFCGAPIEGARHYCSFGLAKETP